MKKYLFLIAILLQIKNIKKELLFKFQNIQRFRHLNLLLFNK